MSNYYPHHPESSPQDPAQRLIVYLQGQFSDARLKERAEDRRAEQAVHGSFIQHSPLEADHSLTKGADVIVLKPPHPDDQPGIFTEVFAIYPHLQSRQESDAVDDAEMFLLVPHGISPALDNRHWLLDQMGVSHAEWHDEPIDASDMSPMERAKVLSDYLEQCNIVAVRNNPAA